MKKIFILFVFLFIFSSFLPSHNAYADNEKVYYAKVQSTGVQLCSMPSENSAVFEIPFSYFVQVEYVIDDYFKVNYDNVSGYVKKDKVKLMKGEPEMPFAKATFKLFVPFGMYESASRSSNLKIQLDNTSTIKYYGTKSGEATTSTNNIWYYSSVTKGGEEFFGYIFSGVTDYLTKIDTNGEVFDVVSEEILDASSTEFSSLSTSTKVMLIVSISVPSLLILYFLIKPSKIMQSQKTRKKVKKENKRVRHGDYFEFDESEL